MRKQQGAVSIFVVIFAMLLFAAVSVGFTVLMLRDQDRATDNDLSQSALDSAKAGVEDAKRVLAKYNDCNERGDNSAVCGDVRTLVQGNSCDTVSKAIDTSASGQEQPVKQSDDDRTLQQAYTCVKITPETDDVVKTIENEGEIKLVPLKSREAYDKVEISWHQKKSGVSYNFNLGAKDGVLGGEKNTATTSKQLPTESKWDPKWGSVLRVQAINYTPGAVKPVDLDAQTRAAFLYPGTGPAGVTTSVDLMTIDAHRPLTDPIKDTSGENLTGVYNEPQNVACSDAGEYVCTAYLNVRPDTNHQTYLTVAGVYQPDGATEFKVRMLKSDGTPVKFDGVQPSIDATGRANDVFRRIAARVETHASLEDAMPLPRAALGAREDICKAYIVTDDPAEFIDSCTSGPSVQMQPNSADNASDPANHNGGGSSPTSPTPGGGGSSSTSPTPGGGGGSSNSYPDKVMIDGKEYPLTVREITKRECVSRILGMCTKHENIRYDQLVYTKQVEQCRNVWKGLRIVRECSTVSQEVIWKEVKK